MNNKDLSPADRSKALIDLYGQTLARTQEDMIRSWIDVNDQWQKELVKEYTQPVLDVKVAKVGALINAYHKDLTDQFKANNPSATPPDFGKAVREAADLTGAGNNPAVMKLFFWVSEQLGEGAPLNGSPAGVPGDRASKLFGGQAK